MKKRQQPIGYFEVGDYVKATNLENKKYCPELQDTLLKVVAIKPNSCIDGIIYICINRDNNWGFFKAFELEKQK